MSDKPELPRTSALRALVASRGQATIDGHSLNDMLRAQHEALREPWCPTVGCVRGFTSPVTGDHLKPCEVCNGTGLSPEYLWRIDDLRRAAEMAEAHVRGLEERVRAWESHCEALSSQNARYVAAVAAERDRLREEVRLAKYGLTGIAEDRSTDPSARARITLRYMRESGDCPRCGNPTCQCYGSAAMSEDRLKHDMQEAQESVAEWSPNKQDAMLSEVNNVRSGSAAMEHERATNEAPHGHCWCRAPLEWGEDINLSRKPESRIVLRCSASLDHKPCLGCGQWVEWGEQSRHRGRYYHADSRGFFPCPAPYGYCTVHPGVPMQNKPTQNEGDTGYLWCPECEEEAAR